MALDQDETNSTIDEQSMEEYAERYAEKKRVKAEVKRVWKKCMQLHISFLKKY